jgi:spore maturation protein CgeB
VRVLVVGAGASWSTKDVENGLYDALQAAGVDTRLYLLDRRIGLSQRWLHTLWRSSGRAPQDRPDWPDIIYHASRDAMDLALHSSVDWVLIISGMFFHPNVVVMMRRQGLKVALLATESPYADPEQARLAQIANVCWTNERTSVPYLSRFNPNTHYLRAAYDPVRHTPVAEVDPDVPRHDVVFVGSGWQERIDLLSAVDWTGIDLGLYGTWMLLPSRHRLRKYLKGGLLSNDQTVALYRAAKIGLNLHRTSREATPHSDHITHAESMNPRGYELAACGVFQLSDYRAEVQETLPSVFTFRNPEALQGHARYFLEHPDERQTVARQARQAVGPHTFAARAAQILADLASYEQPIAKGA